LASFRPHLLPDCGSGDNEEAVIDQPPHHNSLPKRDSSFVSVAIFEFLLRSASCRTQSTWHLPTRLCVPMCLLGERLALGMERPVLSPIVEGKSIDVVARLQPA
jgi:hypothetical protein